MNRYKYLTEKPLTIRVAEKEQERQRKIDALKKIDADMAREKTIRNIKEQDKFVRFLTKKRKSIRAYDRFIKKHGNINEQI